MSCFGAPLCFKSEKFLMLALYWNFIWKKSLEVLERKEIKEERGKKKQSPIF